MKEHRAAHTRLRAARKEARDRKRANHAQVSRGGILKHNFKEARDTKRANHAQVSREGSLKLHF